MAGWPALIHHAGVYPAASFEALGLGLGRLPAVADQPQMKAEGWNPVLLAACWRGLAAPSTGTNPSSCAYSDMFAPTNAQCAASRALFLAPQQFLAAVSPAWSPACRAAGTSTPCLLQSHRDAL